MKIEFGTWPWKNIIIGIVIAAAVGTVVLYVKNAEQNRADLKAEKIVNSNLISANAALKAAADNTINTLQASIAETAEREKVYASTIEELNKIPDTGCARNSPAIGASLRMFRAKAGHPAGSAGGAKRADKPDTAAGGP
jgi:type II secretory pathway pseudopilin PulG